jgi:hypothetical protein
MTADEGDFRFLVGTICGVLGAVAFGTYHPLPALLFCLAIGVGAAVTIERADEARVA